MSDFLNPFTERVDAPTLTKLVDILFLARGLVEFLNELREDDNPIVAVTGAVSAIAVMEFFMNLYGENDPNELTQEQAHEMLFRISEGGTEMLLAVEVATDKAGATMRNELGQTPSEALRHLLTA